MSQVNLALSVLIYVQYFVCDVFFRSYRSLFAIVTHPQHIKYFLFVVISLHGFFSSFWWFSIFLPFGIQQRFSMARTIQEASMAADRAVVRFFADVPLQPFFQSTLC